jgi:hypothetical protein
MVIDLFSHSLVNILTGIFPDKFVVASYGASVELRISLKFDLTFETAQFQFGNASQN